MKNKRYDIALIRDYLDGKLDSSAMYKLERAAQDDPILMDLMLGMEMGEAKDHQNALTEIDSLVNNRLQEKESRILPLWKGTAIAASIILVMGTVFVIFQSNEKQSPIAKLNKPEIEKHKEVKPVPADTLRAAASDKTDLIAQNPAFDLKKPSLEDVESQIKPKRRANLIASNNQNPDTTNHLLDEVVIVGYGSQKKSSITGSVANITSESLAGITPGIKTKKATFGSRLFGRKDEGHPNTLTGTVIDKNTNEPIIGAAIQIDNTKHFTTSDINGNFKLSLDQQALDTLKSKQVQVRMLGYKQENLRLKNKDSLIIALQPSNSSLNEVMVAGRASTEEAKSAGEAKSAEPLMGWKAYKKYLKENGTISSEKKELLIVMLRVDPDGKISELKIIKGNKSLINQVEDLILNGPAWRGNADGEPEMVKIKIELGKE